MSISKDRGRRKKPLITWSGSSTCNRASLLTTTIIIALTTLLIIGGFVLINTPTLMASALFQEGITTIATTGAAATTANTTTETSPAPGIESSSPQPNLNFSEFPVSEVNGTYMNPNIGFQIDLPIGWKGIEINFLINSVIASPGETNLLEPLAFQEPSTFMTILGIDQEGFNILGNVSELIGLRGGGGGGQAGAVGGGEEETLLPGSSDPLGTTTTPFGNNTVSCTYLQPSFVIINGINAEERLGECIDEEGGGGTNPKTKSYAFATQNNSLIVLGFYGNSTGTYDQNLPLFEESVRTINISRPADIATSEIYNRYKELVESQQLSNQTGGGM
ncbi:MAG: hypothetical protein ACREAS_01005 [Nitrososphaera sp.]